MRKSAWLRTTSIALLIGLLLSMSTDISAQWWKIEKNEKTTNSSTNKRDTKGISDTTIGLVRIRGAFVTFITEPVTVSIRCIADGINPKEYATRT